MEKWARDNLNSNTRVGEVIQAAKEADEAIQGALMGMITKKVVAPEDVWLLYNDVHGSDIYDTMSSLLNDTYEAELSALPYHSNPAK